MRVSSLPQRQSPELLLQPDVSNRKTARSALLVSAPRASLQMSLYQHLKGGAGDWNLGDAHPWACSMTSGAIQQGVPTKVLRPPACWPQEPSRSIAAATPKSASSTVPSCPTRMLPACSL